MSAFKEYVSDQIVLLEAQFAENQKQQYAIQRERKKAEASSECRCCFVNLQLEAGENVFPGNESDRNMYGLSYR